MEVGREGRPVSAQSRLGQRVSGGAGGASGLAMRERGREVEARLHGR